MNKKTEKSYDYESNKQYSEQGRQRETKKN